MTKPSAAAPAVKRTALAGANVRCSDASHLRVARPTVPSLWQTSKRRRPMRLLVLALSLAAVHGFTVATARALVRPSRPIVLQEMPNSEEGWMTVLSPNQFAILRNAATEPPGYSELKEGELEYQLKKEYKTKYPTQGAYTCVAW